jgi:DNA-binding NtrC family response regulator
MLQTTKPRVVLLGLEEALSAELGAVLPAQKYSLIPERFSSPAECLRTIERTGADLVFCAAESNRHLAVLEAIACQRPDVLVIVVSRAPDVSEWLDAIEAGATD